jgi:hypothetical protein
MKDSLGRHSREFRECRTPQKSWIPGRPSYRQLRHAVSGNATGFLFGLKTGKRHAKARRGNTTERSVGKICFGINPNTAEYFLLH